MTITSNQPSTNEKLSHALAMFAKLLCSGTFVIGRDPDEFLKNDLHTHLRPEGMPFQWDDVEVSIDRDDSSVTLSAHGVSRTARCHAGQGCTIIPEGADGVHFTPVEVTPNVPDPDATPWPAGDVSEDDPAATGADLDQIHRTLAWGFDDSQLPAPVRTRAVVVTHKDQIIAERYAPGFDKDTRHVSWSMGKSITAALIGILVGDGHFTIEDRAPVAEWSGAEDPRREITIANLLNMSSGLDFIRAQDDDKLELGWTSGDDHMYIYYGAINVFDHSVSRKLAYPPNTRWAYRNGDPLTLGKIVRETVEARGENYLTFPQRRLFDPIGMRNMVLETDPWGNFIMTGYDYGTARDWTRFGLLHLHDGVWAPTGERILPEGWVDFVRSPAPAADEQQYGGQFWLNAGGRHPDIPRDAYWPSGAWGQVTMIVPSKDLVMVRLGHTDQRDESFDHYLNKLVGGVVKALPD
ncbi:MAG: serine hydrolase domain-containing protein [Chloroflexota bacterium]